MIDFGAFKLTRADFSDLREQGVPGFGFTTGVPAARLGILRIQTADRFFEPVDHAGMRAWLIPDGRLVYLNGPERPPTFETVEELVAIAVDDPTGGWWVFRGDWPVLGWHELNLAQFCHLPVTLHPDPWAWLKAAGKGVVVLDWRADLTTLFDPVAAIRATTPGLATHFNRTITAQRAPRLRATYSEVQHGEAA